MTNRIVTVDKTMQHGMATSSRTERYKELQRKEKRVHRGKKDAWENKIVHELESYRENHGQARKFYQTVHNMKVYTPRTTYWKPAVELGRYPGQMGSAFTRTLKC